MPPRLTDTQIIRLEQLYPFPGEPLALRLRAMPGLEDVVWCRKSRRTTVRGSSSSRDRSSLIAAKSGPTRPRYAGREASASPATGLAKPPRQRTGRADRRMRLGAVGPFRNPRRRKKA